MERIYQMKVVPDALPELNPTIDLQVIARTSSTVFLYKAIEAGIYLRPIAKSGTKVRIFLKSST
jgi:large subunit ribosomal protein L35